MLKVAIRCTVADIGSNSYMTKTPMTALAGVPSCAGNLVGFLRWAKVNAVGISNSIIVNITVSAKAVVGVEDLRISTVRRANPLRTTRIDCAGGQGDDSNFIYAAVNLDDNPPTVHYICNNRACQVPNVTLGQGGNVQIHISAYSAKNLVLWQGRIDLLVNGRLITLDLGKYVTTPENYKGILGCEPHIGGWSCSYPK